MSNEKAALTEREIDQMLDRIAGLNHQGGIVEAASRLRRELCEAADRWIERENAEWERRKAAMSPDPWGHIVALGKRDDDLVASDTLKAPIPESADVSGPSLMRELARLGQRLDVLNNEILPLLTELRQKLEVR